MPEIICHLGLHKTATGTLQRQFFPSCRDLNLLTTHNVAVREFIQLVTRQDPLYFRAERAIALIERELREDRINLLSNESLSGPPYAGVVEWGLDHRSPVLRNLSAVFPAARVVLVLRRQDGLARSLYRQYLKRGGTAAVQRFFGMDRSDRPPLMSLDRFCFSPFVRYVFETFPSGVLVLTFEQFVREQAKFLECLCQFIGAERPQIGLHAENSTRLGPVGMEVTRLMNHLFSSVLTQSLLPRIPVRRRGQWRQVSVVELIHDNWPGRPKLDKNTALARVSGAIWETFREDNRALDREFGLGLEEFGYF